MRNAEVCGNVDCLRNPITTCHLEQNGRRRVPFLRGCNSHGKQSISQKGLHIRPQAHLPGPVENPQERPQRPSSSYHLSSATSAAIPGPNAIITPQSPGRGSPLRTTSSKTNMTVGEDIFP